MGTRSETSGPWWRLATRADDDAVVALVSALYREDPGDEEVPVANTRRTLEAFRADPVRGRVVVLDRGEGPEGYAFLVSFWSNELGGEVCEIDELYVAPSLRGQGCASTLLRAVAQGSELWTGIPPAMCLQVTPDNARARALYLRLGFREWKNSMLVSRLHGGE